MTIPPDATKADSDAQSFRPGFFIPMLIFTILSVVINKTAVRAIPGGPFISITANVIPFVSSGLALVLGLLCLRSKPVFPIAIVTITCILLVTFCMAMVIGDVYSTWMDPRMRGWLLGYNSITW